VWFFAVVCSLLSLVVFLLCMGMRLRKPVVGTQKCRIFIHLSLHYSLHFIAQLNLCHIIFINTIGFHIIIFHFIHFSIKSEFMIKYWKIYMFSYISQLCVSFVMCRNMWMINSKRLLEYLFHHSKGDNYSSLFSRRRSWRFG
jgi:hypothetical protein